MKKRRKKDNNTLITNDNKLLFKNNLKRHNFNTLIKQKYFKYLYKQMIRYNKILIYLFYLYCSISLKKIHIKFFNINK